MRARISTSTPLDVATGYENNSPPPATVAEVSKTKSEEPTIAEQVWQVIALIPKGRVATYGQVAELAGLPGGARRVGKVLSQLPSGTRIPWHRVVNASGGISLPEASGGYVRQQTRLKKEGIVFSASGRIPLRKYRWQP